MGTPFMLGARAGEEGTGRPGNAEPGALQPLREEFGRGALERARAGVPGPEVCEEPLLPPPYHVMRQEASSWPAKAK